MKGKRGFTLIEIIIVLALIGLITGLTTTFFAHSLAKTGVTSAIGDVKTVLRYARSLARSTGKTKVFTLDLDSNQYWIGGMKKASIPRSVRITVADPFAGEIDSGTYRIFFYPAGNSPGATITLSYGERSTRIYLDPIVGSVFLR
ncbi:MAG: prepilin-type N-terminal cleavage/methylation domain-containing protein [Deltaproteobacteria bacterium]|nr:prepilin-type N-terminal cleavage/methylation domain-containing protein [Deltaproteobacteria bacterium]NIS76319.1 prepilin-type N-terminal cleavage/methylation domain-containing protein [Deltaproteobacteria bacterium]